MKTLQHLNDLALAKRSLFRAITFSVVALTALYLHNHHYLLTFVCFLVGVGASGS